MTKTPNQGPDFRDTLDFDDASTGTAVSETSDDLGVPDFDLPEPGLPSTPARLSSDTGPEFSDEPSDGPDLAAPAQGAALPVPTPPVSPPAVDAASARPRQVSGAANRRMHAIVGTITAIAILAIGLAVFLPRERSQKQPQAGQQTTQAPTPSPVPTPNQQTQQATNQNQQTNQWAQQWNQEFQQKSAQAKAQNQNQTATSNSGGDQTASNQDGGQSWKTCPDCGGEGTKPCPMKHLPNGHMLNPLFWAEARYYSGNDPLLPEDADMGPCPYCGGKLRVPCGKCEGQGKVLEQPAAPAPGTTPGGGAGVVDGATIDSIARQLMGSGGQ